MKIASVFVMLFLSLASTVAASQEMTVLLGQYRSVEQYSRALSANRFSISPSAMAILSQADIARNKVSVDIVIVSQRELGLTEPVSPSVVFARAHERGLVLCAPEVALALRLLLPARNFQWLNIAMSPLDMDGIPGVLIVGAAAGSGGMYATDAKSPNLPQMLWVFTRAYR